jgi:hypothetical protein
LHVEASDTKEELLMTPMFLRACGVAAALGVSMAAFAQTTGQQPASPQPRTQTTPATSQAGSAAGQTVTVSGCIQGEADYRKAHNLARGGALGTGVGAGNEFVLIDVRMASATTAPAAGAPTGTTGAAAQAYEITGTNEGKAAQFAGKRVEITGMLKPAEAAGTAPTGGPTAGAPPRGVDVASEDLKLREL